MVHYKRVQLHNLTLQKSVHVTKRFRWKTVHYKMVHRHYGMIYGKLQQAKLHQLNPYPGLG
jgi:hypothetical protein